MDQAVARDGTKKYMLDLSFVVATDSGIAGWRYTVFAYDGTQKLWGPIALKMISGPVYN